MTGPVRSKKYLAGSRGQPCAFRIPGVCSGDPDTTIPAHIRDAHTGRGAKASDLSAGDCCFCCHEVFDRRAKLPSGEYLSEADWTFYALRALQQTIEGREARGLLVVSRDLQTPISERPVAPRKAKEDRAPVAKGRPLPSGRGFGPGRPLQSTNRLRKDRRDD